MLKQTVIFNFCDTLFLTYFTAVNTVYLILLILGSIKVFKRKKDVYFEDFTNILQSNSLPEISFVVPAFNEEKNILKTVDNLLHLSYRYKQIIIVNDGSSDQTLAILKKHLDLIPIEKYYDEPLATAEVKQVYFSKKNPECLVIDKENGKGKFDAMNAGINATKNPYYIAIDADTIIEDTTFLCLIRPLLTNPELVAVGASIKIRNGCSIGYRDISTATFPQNALPALQNLEYMRSFLERQGWDYLGGNFVLAGAFGIFKRDEIVAIGGYAQTVAEDMEIIIRLHRLLKERGTPYLIMYLPDPVAWTEAPETLKALKRQRIHWHRGLLDCLWFHKKTFCNPRYGIFGYFVYPFWIWGEAIEPVVEVIGILYIIAGSILGVVHIHFILLFLVVTWGFTLLFTALCIMIEEFSFNRYSQFRSICYLFVYNLIENLGYRQMNLIWRVQGCFNFLKNRKSVQKVSRRISSLMKTSTQGSRR